jgi:hypothetical protein
MPAELECFRVQIDQVCRALPNGASTATDQLDLNYTSRASHLHRNAEPAAPTEESPMHVLSRFLLFLALLSSVDALGQTQTEVCGQGLHGR